MYLDKNIILLMFYDLSIHLLRLNLSQLDYDFVIQLNYSNILVNSLYSNFHFNIFI